MFTWRFFRLLMILVLILTSTSETMPRARAQTALEEPEEQVRAAPQAEMIVYADALAPGWEDWSWDSTVDFDNPNPTLTGAASIAVTFNAAWAGFSVRTAPALQSTDFTAISFFVYAPDTDRSLTMMIQATDGGGESERFDFNAPANEWSQIVVGLDSLGYPPAIARLNIADNSGASQPTFYLDQISLLTSGSSGGSDIPADLPGAPKAIITLSTGHGYSGQTVVASGTAPSGFEGVRLAWLFDGATFTAGETAVGGSGDYSASLEVPTGAPEGPARLCAAVTGTPQAVFTCADFVIDPPAPAEISGQVDPALLAPGQAAEVRLLNAAGDALYTAPLSASGAFSFTGIRPDLYQYAVVGRLARPAAFGKIDALTPGSKRSLQISPISAALPDAMLDPVTGIYCFPEDNLATVSTLSARYSNRNASVSAGMAAHSPAAADAFGFAYPLKYALTKMALAGRADFGSYFGTYLSGVMLENTFTAGLSMTNTGGQPVRVDFHVVLPDGTVRSLNPVPQPAYTAAYDMGQLPPGVSILVAAPVVEGERQCPLTREIRVSENPMVSPIYQPGAFARWNAGQQVYEFGGVLPNVGGLLPLSFPSNPTYLPYLGNIQSRLAAGLSITGVIHLNGMVQLQAVSASAQAVLFGRQVFDKSQGISPPKGAGIYTGKRGYRDLTIPLGQRTLWQDRYEQTVFTGPIFSFLGIVTVGASVRFGISGALVLDATIFPLQPNVDIRLVPKVGVNLALSLWVNVLILASAGADAIPSVHLALPLHINPRDNRKVWFDDPCYGIRVDLKMWVEVDYFFDKWRRERTENLFQEDEPDGCVFGVAKLGAAQLAAQLLKQAEANAAVAPPNPRVMASPVVVTSSKGSVLSVYIEDRTPGAELPSPAVMARFKDPQTGNWLPAVQLSDGQHAVNDPAATFYETPQSEGVLVAWSQTEMTQAEESTADSLDDYLNRLEIYYSYWNGQTWSGPLRLTNDMRGDGFPVLAGDKFFGIATLAWVRDGDGDSTTLSDVNIAASIWNSTTTSWSAPSTLGSAPSGLNFEASVDRIDDWTIVAWTYDEDGNHETLEDRYLTMALRGGEIQGWYRFTPQPVLSRAGQPSVIFDPCCHGSLLRLAFVMHMLDADGESSAAVGDNLAIWTANVDLTGGTPAITAQPLLDEAGRVVRGERPRLHTGINGETLLTFRRFGEVGSTGQLGQVAVSQYMADQDQPNFSPPVYLTGGLAQYWQAAAALNPLNNRLELLAVQRPVINPAALQALGGLENLSGSTPVKGGTTLSQEALGAAYEQVALLRSLATNPLPVTEGSAAALTQATDDPLLSMTYGPDGDPALDPALLLSKSHAAAGSDVTVTATVRNLGRTAVPLTVRFFRGLPGSGNQVSEQVVGQLAGGAVTTVSTVYTVQGGDEPVYAQVVADPSYTDANTANNISSANLGALPAPQIASVQPSQVFERALEVAILPGEAEAVSGYRTLRSPTPGGPYELVGETTGEVHYDLGLSLGQVYCYVVQAYDRSGLTSPFSGEVCNLVPGNSLFLPLLMR